MSDNPMMDVDNEMRQLVRSVGSGLSRMGQYGPGRASGMMRTRRATARSLRGRSNGRLLQTMHAHGREAQAGAPSERERAAIGEELSRRGLHETSREWMRVSDERNRASARAGDRQEEAQARAEGAEYRQRQAEWNAERVEWTVEQEEAFRRRERVDRVREDSGEESLSDAAVRTVSAAAAVAAGAPAIAALGEAYDDYEREEGRYFDDWRGDFTEDNAPVDYDDLPEATPESDMDVDYDELPEATPEGAESAFVASLSEVADGAGSSSVGVEPSEEAVAEQFGAGAFSGDLAETIGAESFASSVGSFMEEEAGSALGESQSAPAAEL